MKSCCPKKVNQVEAAGRYPVNLVAYVFLLEGSRELLSKKAERAERFPMNTRTTSSRKTLKAVRWIDFLQDWKAFWFYNQLGIISKLWYNKKISRQVLSYLLKDRFRSKSYKENSYTTELLNETETQVKCILFQLIKSRSICYRICLITIYIAEANLKILLSIVVESLKINQLLNSYKTESQECTKDTQSAFYFDYQAGEYVIVSVSSPYIYVYIKSDFGILISIVALSFKILELLNSNTH